MITKLRSFLEKSVFINHHSSYSSFGIILCIRNDKTHLTLDVFKRSWIFCIPRKSNCNKRYGFKISDHSNYFYTQLFCGKTLFEWFPGFFQNRFYRYSVFGESGSILYTEFNPTTVEQNELLSEEFIKFKLLDFNGQEIIASTVLEEYEWRAGTGFFRWLSWFKKPIIHKQLYMSFDPAFSISSNTIRLKSLDETPEDIVKRFCSNFGMTFVSRLD